MTVHGKTFVLLLLVLLPAAGCRKASKPPGPEDVRKANDEVRSVIKKTVQDGERRAQLEALVDELSRQAAELAAAGRREAKAMAALNRNYDATQQDFENATVPARQERRMMYEVLLDSLLEMRSLTDSKEWKAIVKKEKKALVTQLSAKEE